LAEYFEKESEYAVKNMTAAMEPMIIVVLAVGVGFMVVAIIMPIYSLTSQF
jgi:type IV pilus assembly protein PilC